MTIPGADDNSILSLFDGAGPVETPTPGVKAWLARDMVTATESGPRPVLIKRLDGGGARKARATEALALVHPNIVRTRRWLTAGENGSLYVVRDVIRGRNLQQSLVADSMRQSAEAVRQMLLPVLDALEHAHAQGFAHGGISPANILIGEGGQVYVSDFATADPSAPPHKGIYFGSATVLGDIKALGKVVTEFLPKTGAFANPVVRGRIEGIVERCDTLADLRATVNALERLAAAPVPRSEGRPAAAATPPPTPQLKPAPAERTVADWVKNPGPPFATSAPALKTAPRMDCLLAEKPARLPPGSGGAATLILRNPGDAPLIVRMVATQHAWLNVRPLELPLTIPPGGAATVGFVISTARLTPGEYRSEVYLSANAGGSGSEDLRAGWFKHTCEVRVTVEGPGTFSGGGGGNGGGTRTPGNGGASAASAAADAPKAAKTNSAGKPPFPENAPRLPAQPGCGVIALALAVLFSAAFGAAAAVASSAPVLLRSVPGP